MVKYQWIQINNEILHLLVCICVQVFIQYLHVHCCLLQLMRCSLVCISKLQAKHVLHSKCLVLQSRKFVSARPCISSEVSCLALSQLEVLAAARGFKLSSGSLNWLSRLRHAFTTLLSPTCAWPYVRHGGVPQWGIRWEKKKKSDF